MHTEEIPYFENGKQIGWLVHLSASQFVVFNNSFSNIIRSSGFDLATLSIKTAIDSEPWTAEQQLKRKELLESMLAEYGTIEDAFKAFGVKIRKSRSK